MRSKETEEKEEKQGNGEEKGKRKQRKSEEIEENEENKEWGKTRKQRKPSTTRKHLEFIGEAMRTFVIKGRNGMPSSLQAAYAERETGEHAEQHAAKRRRTR